MLNFNFRRAVSVCCETGDLRTCNQDRIFFRDGIINKKSVGLYAVADGCGGMSYGSEISQLIVNELGRRYEQDLPDLVFMKKIKTDTVLERLRIWMTEINHTAYEFGQSVHKPVGSTIVLLLIVENVYYLLSSGDSRIYRFRNHSVQRLTVDQTKLSDMLRNGEISPEMAATYPEKNVLTMCVGFFEHPQFYCASGKIKRNDIFLLCSDGLYNAYTENELEAAIPLQIEQNSAIELRNGISLGAARDNVSAVIVQIVSSNNSKHSGIFDAFFHK